MNDELALRLKAQYGAVSTADALACGHTWLDLSRLVARGELVRVRTGAYVDAPLHAAASPGERLALRATAVCRSLGMRYAVSHAAAVALAGLPVLGASTGTVHLTRLTPGKTRSSAGKSRASAGVAMHPVLPARAIGTVRGVPVVLPAFAVLQLAALRGLEAGVVAADAAVNRRLVRAEDLRAALEQARLGPGAGAARAVLTLVDGRSESVGESRTRVLLRAVGLPPPQLQAEIRDPQGRLVGRVDFLFRAERTVVEFDGLVKYGEDTARQALIAEKRREDRLRALGLEVVRLTWRDLEDPAGCLALVRGAFARARRVG